MGKNKVVSKPSTTVVRGSNDPYATLVKRISGLLRDANRMNLQVTRRVGKEVAELVNVKRAATYGYKKIETLASDLVASGWPVKADTLYAAKAIFERLTSEQYKLAQEAGIAVRTLIPLCADRVTPELRTKILQEAAQKKMNRAQVADMINQLIQKDPKRLESPAITAETAMGPKQAMTVLSGCAKMLERIADRKPQIAEAAKAVADGDDIKKMSTALTLIDSIESSADTLNKYLVEQLGETKKSVTKMQKATKGD